jgi:hypothetical protein
LAETAKYTEHPAKSLHCASFRLRSLTPHMGAKVLDLDLANPLKDPEILPVITTQDSAGRNLQ